MKALHRFLHVKLVLVTPGPEVAGRFHCDSSHSAMSPARAFPLDTIRSLVVNFEVRRVYNAKFGLHSASRTSSNATNSNHFCATVQTNIPTHLQRATWQIDAPVRVHYSRCRTSGPACGYSGQAKPLVCENPTTPGSAFPEYGQGLGTLGVLCREIVSAAAYRKGQGSRGVIKGLQDENRTTML